MLQPATKALAQMLAGRTGVSGQLGHARTMLAQAERMIAERAHNRLTPAEREEFFEQLARLKLTLADADAEAEVQAVEEQEPRPQAPPVAQERLKEMALALSVRERPSHAEAGAQPATQADAAEPSTGDRSEEPGSRTEPSDEGATDEQATPAPAVPGRLVLPKATAHQAAQAVAVGAFARRRSRAAAAASAATADAARAAENPPPTETFAAEPLPAETSAVEPQAGERHGPEPRDGAAGLHEGNGASARAETKARAKSTARRGRKPKHQGLPKGWVIDEEGFVVPGVD